MNLPGFTAEAAIQRLGRDYTKEIVHEFTSSSVVRKRRPWPNVTRDVWAVTSDRPERVS